MMMTYVAVHSAFVLSILVSTQHVVSSFQPGWRTNDRLVRQVPQTQLQTAQHHDTLRNHKRQFTSDHRWQQLSSTRSSLFNSRPSRIVTYAVSHLQESAESSSQNTTSEDSDLPHSVNENLPVTAVTATAASSSLAAPGAKLRRLKDTMWVREALEDLTAAEFALSVESAEEDESKTSSGAKARKKRKRAVDYEKLVTQLDRRIRDLGYDVEGITNGTTTITKELLVPGVGMGALTYTEKQRTALLERLLQTRRSLVHTIRSVDEELQQIADKLENELPFNIELPELPRVGLPKEPSNETSSSGSSSGPKLYVRDDGTVDWDGALQDQAALRKFGKAVWARINGRDSDSLDDDENGNVNTAANGHSPSKSKEVTAKIEETPEIRAARERLDILSQTLREYERNYVQLLNSALTEGQAVANVRLATLEPGLRSKIQQSANEIKLIKEKVSFQTLIYELERIYTYLMGEIGNPSMQGYIPLQDRLNVAEFGLLESQIDSLRNQIELNEIVDEDLLTVVYDQLTDFKRRLGIDYYVTGVTFDQETIKRYLGELLEQTKKGLAFYVKGVQLFWNDLVFCLRLFNRAAQGYTLKPREVRTLRRTFKDIITFIPFVIILLIPLSPIGHVLVFGAIQRFFPDFFPSCFTEQRQNLLQLYESAEYSEYTINETFNQKLSRITEAFLFVIASSFKKALFNLQRAIANSMGFGGGTDTSSENDNERKR